MIKLKIINIQIPSFILIPLVLIIVFASATPILKNLLDDKIPPQIIKIEERIKKLSQIDNLNKYQKKEKAHLERIFNRFKSKPSVKRRVFYQTISILFCVSLLLSAMLLSPRETLTSQIRTSSFPSHFPPHLNETVGSFLSNFSMHSMRVRGQKIIFRPSAQAVLMALSFTLVGVSQGAISFVYKQSLQLGVIFLW
jgi:hypothetical protein